MDIVKAVERQRAIMQTLKNWDAVIKAKKDKATYGCGREHSQVKVQKTMQIDIMENAIIDYADMEVKKMELLCEHMDNMKVIDEIVWKYGKTANQMEQVSRYARGDIAQTQTVRNALRHIQSILNREEEAKLHSKDVYKLIMGGCKRCKACETGFISLKNEKADKYIFKCDKCEKLYRVTKKNGADQDDATTYEKND